MSKDKSTNITQESPDQLKIAELTSDLQRTRADFENYRKNIEKEKQSLRQLTEESTVLKLLPLIDELSLAISSYEKELSPLKKTLEKSLKSLNLTPIETKPGTEFNPKLHEAVMTEGEGEKEEISATLRPGYLYGDRVLRAAMVKIKLS
ncbi:nucleotide exchange factor GrpE [Candidatus Saccharibacteria bacterium]|nr:nucleotide exchange factor GrpE [Candidatus Saccharibacteria bacterium]